MSFATVRRHWTAFVIALLLLGGAVRPSAAEPQAHVVAERLAGLPDVLRTRHGSVRALVVIRGGRLVFEYHRAGSGPDDFAPVASVTKSVTSTLVGIALGQGAIRDLDQRLGEFLPEALDPGVDPRARAITVRQLLKMNSGFDPDASPTADGSGPSAL